MITAPSKLLTLEDYITYDERTDKPYELIDRERDRSILVLQIFDV